MERCSAAGGYRLSVADRRLIENGCRAGFTLTAIATLIGKSTSAISREVGANGGRQRYRAEVAQLGAEDRARRPKQTKLEANPVLRDRVEADLEALLSPEQIAGQLRREFPEDPEMQVHHETIYRELFVQGRGALRAELHRCLRSGRARRVTRAEARQARNSGRGHIPDMVNIVERDEEVEGRRVPGHWEGDLITGTKNGSAIGTLVERSTRYVMLFALPDGRTAEEVRAAMTTQIMSLPEHLRRSVTWDQGKEMHEHAQLTIDTGIQIYFCDPHSPWQRGSNENTNGLLRQYFPKGTDLTVHSQADLNRVAHELNGRPRQTLGWMKPCERLAEPVATTA
jgi:IS30 family transposase